MGTAADIGRAIREHTARSTRDTMLLARANVTAATPVDTEHAASNWVLSVGRPYTEVCGSREAVSYTAQAAGDDEVRDYNADDVRRNRKIYLRNNVFYLRFLDNGWSQQAPANFIALALASNGAGRHMPVGTRRATKSMLRKLTITAIKRG